MTINYIPVVWRFAIMAAFALLSVGCAKHENARTGHDDLFSDVEKERFDRLSAALLENSVERCVDAIDQLGPSREVIARKFGIRLIRMTISKTENELIINHLFDIGIPLETDIGKGVTPLYYAVEMGNEAACKTILERGGNPNAGTASGNAPFLRVLTMDGLENIADMLLQFGADSQAEEADGTTWVDILSNMESDQYMLSLLTVLTKHRVDLNGKSKISGGTLLHSRVRIANPEADGYPGKVIRYMIRNGADPDIVNKEGETARDIFLELNSEETVEAFLGLRQAL